MSEDSKVRLTGVGLRVGKNTKLCLCLQGRSSLERWPTGFSQPSVASSRSHVGLGLWLMSPGILPASFNCTRLQLKASFWNPVWHPGRVYVAFWDVWVMTFLPVQACCCKRTPILLMALTSFTFKSLCTVSSVAWRRWAMTPAFSC